MKVNLSIPMNVCTGCGHDIREGETALLRLHAGSAWKNGVAIFEDGAEMYTATVLCAECQKDTP